MSEVSVVEIQKQLNVVITTTRVETVVAPNTNVVKGGIIIRLQQTWVMDRAES